MGDALLFHILANAYIYLHLKDTREGKAFYFLPMFAGMNCTKTAHPLSCGIHRAEVFHF